MTLRIALVTPILPMPFDPTRGRFIYETAKSLSKLACVKVFLQQARYPRLSWLKPRSFVYGDLNADFSLPGLDVEAYDYPVLPGLSRSINGHLSSLKLRPRMAQFKPDVVIGYWVYPDGFAALRCARQLGVPAVIGALGSDIHLRQGVNAWLTRYTLQHADAIVVVSEAMRRFTIDTYGAAPERTYTVVNGFNTQVFQLRDRTQARQALQLPLTDELITYVGRFIEAKGLLELIDAFARLIAQRPHARLALIGSGVLDGTLRQLVEARGLKGKVYFPGGLEPEQVAQWMAASHVVTLPSWSEGYPNVVVEGIACGRPVVATDVGGTREIISVNNGILIPPKQPEVLARALSEALERPWVATDIAQSIRRSWDDVAQDTLNICQRLLPRTSESRIP